MQPVGLARQDGWAQECLCLAARLGDTSDITHSLTLWTGSFFFLPPAKDPHPSFAQCSQLPHISVTPQWAGGNWTPRSCRVSPYSRQPPSTWSFSTWPSTGASIISLSTVQGRLCWQCLCVMQGECIHRCIRWHHVHLHATHFSNFFPFEQEHSSKFILSSLTMMQNETRLALSLLPTCKPENGTLEFKWVEWML